MKKLTQEEVIKRIKSIFDYDCSNVKYVNTLTKVKLVCPKHGEFEQLPKLLFNNIGCQKCSGKYHYSTNDFLKVAKKLHPEYNYSKTRYLNGKNKITIVCPKHGEFEIRGDKFLAGGKCPKCSKTYHYTNQDFLEKVKKLLPEYDYSKTKYINSKTKVIVICKRHGEFEIAPGSLLLGKKCYKCSHNVPSNKEFIDELRTIHPEYDYSNVKYINNTTKIKIICPKHGEFETTPQILKKSSCPFCNVSKGEKAIKFFLEKNNIEFEKNKKYEDLKDVKKLSYDFYLPEYNLLIEYNGTQHYKNIYDKPIHEWHRQLHHDWLKRKYANDNNIKLLTIKYKEEFYELIR